MASLASAIVSFEDKIRTAPETSPSCSIPSTKLHSTSSSFACLPHPCLASPIGCQLSRARFRKFGSIIAAAECFGPHLALGGSAKAQNEKVSTHIRSSTVFVCTHLKMISAGNSAAAGLLLFGTLRIIFALDLSVKRSCRLFEA